MRSLIVGLILLLPFAAVTSAGEISVSAPGYRGPEDLLLSADESRLYTANRQSGSISVVDLERKLAVEEFAVGGEPVQLAWLSQDRILLVDQAGHRLVLLAVAVPPEEKGPLLEVLDECQVAPYPIRVEVSADGSVAYVSSIWSKAITKVALAGETLKNPQIQYLTFSPREMLLLAEDTKLLVSDNFSGRVGVVDTATLTLEHARDFPAHNIRSMRLSHDGHKVIFAHQMLNSLAVTNHNDIHWGLLMSNDLRWLNVDNLLDATADFYRESFMQPIGQPNEGGGDPTDVALIPDGQVIVTLGGASEVGIGKEGSYGLHRTNVSGRPMAVTVPTAGKIAYVACANEDAIAVIDIKNVREIERIPLGPMRPLTQVEEGEKLFFDSRLSMEGWMSCHSCHTDGHSSGLANDNLSDGSFGTPKKILSLLGKRDTAPFGWSGNSATMADQVRASIDKTMRGEPLEEPQVAALVAFLETMEPPPSIDKLQQTRDQSSIERGRLVFLQNNCVACHAPPTYTTPKNYDVGIHDQDGVREFNPPTLRGVGHRQSFFHDAEVDQLEKVFTEEQHQLAEELSERQVTDLVNFLRSLE